MYGEGTPCALESEQTAEERGYRQQGYAPEDGSIGVAIDHPANDERTQYATQPSQGAGRTGDGRNKLTRKQVSG